MKATLLPIAVSALGLAGLSAQTPNFGALTLVDEAGVNELEITISALNDSDTKTSTLTGTLDAQLNIDTDAGATNLFVIEDAAVQASDVTFNLGNFLIGATINTNDLAGTADTPLGLGPVNPANGEFEAVLHTFTIDSGTLDGSALFTPIDVDIAESPITGPGAGTGTLILSNPVEGADFKITYTVTLVLPIDFSDIVPTGVEGQDAEVGVVGTIKAVGTAFAFRTPTYDEWADSQELATGSQANFSVTDAMPNELVYALGLDSNFFADDLLTPSANGVTFGFGQTPTRDDILIEFSDNLTTWLPAPPNHFESGLSLVPKGFTGEITISPESRARFYRVSLVP
ncbi:MAG: hypothetical protein QNL77_04945 [Akkermansiaceae bacterium]